MFTLGFDCNHHHDASKKFQVSYFTSTSQSQSTDPRRLGLLLPQVPHRLHEVIRPPSTTSYYSETGSIVDTYKRQKTKKINKVDELTIEDNSFRVHHGGQGNFSKYSL